MSYKRWTFLQVNKDVAVELSEACGLDPMLCLLMTGRGITDPDEAMDFLVGNDLQSDPFEFADMDLAVDRIQRAIDEGESIMVYGDYDADGVTAPVLLYSYLRDKGARVAYRLPRRDGEGYGLHRESIEEMAEQGVQLIVTVDNGISAVDEIDFANECGIDVVVTDHHQPQEQLPNAVAVVDPHRRDCPSVFKEFAGVGVAFQLVCALEGDPDWAIQEYGDLVALGTLADVMPLRHDNRVLVRRGLQRINTETRLGFCKLREQAVVSGTAQTATSVAFTLAPRINAAGRMGDPTLASALLLSTDAEEATCLAQEIGNLNRERQETETTILTPLIEKLSHDPERLADRVLVVWGEGWHHGVLGILAARLQERYGKPCVVLSAEDGIAHGSGRSLQGFSLFEALKACEDCLLGFGGHELAAGVTLEAARLEEFRKQINAYAAQAAPTMPVPEVRMDCRLRPEQIKPAFLDCLSALEPFGAGNPSPVFGLYRMTVERIEAVGGGKHLRLTLTRDGVRLTAMKFGTTLEQFPFTVGDTVNASVTLDRNEYRGTVNVSIFVRDLRHADADQEAVITALQQHDAVLRRDLASTVMPNRDCAVSVYRYLKRGTYCGSVDALLRVTASDAYTDTDVLVSLTLLREAGLIEWRNNGDTVCAAVTPVEGKHDLMLTATAQYLQSKEG
ncbi:MAG: single-stranded-DNA-specific exonuclease RecJ [Clostridia bacterium]|nr:single-stranded-DNA-specific exonuclease RecJ [Clostridia bacterium]